IGDPHRGFQQQMNQFQDERMVPIVMAPVVSRQVWEATLKHSQERVVFGKPLAKMQVNQHKFVDMMIQITAAEEFARRCIRKVVRGEDATLDISMAKVFCTAVEQFVANTCVQLFGGAGYCWENPAARAFVDSRLVSIGGGADEVLKTVWEFPKPIVGRINGHAFGGGVGLAAACDLTVAAESALFAFSEVRVGVIPAMISVLCIRKLGIQQAMWLFLTGERVSAA